MDLTKEGMAHGQQQQYHNYYGGGGGGGGGSGSYGWNVPPYSKKSNSITNIVCGVVLVIMIYAFYKTCIAPSPNRQYR